MQYSTEPMKVWKVGSSEANSNAAIQPRHGMASRYR